MNRSNKYINLVTYFGGKFPHLNWLLPLLPKGKFHFIDLMCGAANVALNVDYPLITVNDQNDEIINLFLVLRNRPKAFLEKLYFTPFSRAELNNIREANKTISQVERARRYFVRCQQGFAGNGGQNFQKGLGFEYFFHHLNGHRVDNWNNKITKLPLIIEKLRSFQIESLDAIELLDKLNNPNNLIYVDPPYLRITRSDRKRYMHECNDQFHIDLSKKLTSTKALVAVSGYDSILYNELYSGFFKHLNRKTRANTKKKESQECLWCNYDIRKFTAQQKIF